MTELLAQVLAQVLTALIAALLTQLARKFFTDRQVPSPVVA